MVKSVTGRVDGVEIIFRRNEAGRWETTVPADPDNTYVIELWAEDFAGNRSYFATIKVTFDAAKLQAGFEIMEVGTGFSIQEVLELFGADRFDSTACISEFESSITMEEYSAEIN